MAQQGVQGLDRRFFRQQRGIGFADVAEVDKRMGRTQFRHAPAHEVDQRVDTGSLDVRVFLQVVGAVEEPGDLRAGGYRKAEIAADSLRILFAAPQVGRTDHRR